MKKVMFKNIFFLMLIFIPLVSLTGQGVCYDTKLDHSGLNIVNDSLEYFSCEIGGKMPVEVDSDFKAFSVVEYSLDKFKTEEDRNIFLLNTLDSISNVNPFHLVYWWRPVAGNNFGSCQVYFDFPNDDDYQNCFTGSKIAVLKASIQEYIRQEIANYPATSTLRLFRDIELGATKLLLDKITALQDCCAGENKDGDSCSLCPTTEELDLLRTSILKVHQYGTEIELSNEVDYSTFIPSASSNDNYDFYDYTGTGGLTYGDVYIDIEAELDSFVNEFGTHCSPTVYLMNDEAFCSEAIDENIPNQTVFYVGQEENAILSKNSNQVNMLAIGWGVNNSCELFLDYVIDEYPEVFGYRIEMAPARGGLEEEAPLGNEVKYCYFTPTGLLLYKQDYSFNGPLQI
jgi:hypothetical protein